MAKKSRYVAVGLAFLLALSVLLTGGEAKAEDTWIEITSKSQLEGIRTNLSGKFRLMCDIDLNDTTWTPVGSEAQPFIGTLDGNGKTVRNFSINNTSTANQGLFAVIGSGGSVSHLAIEDATVTAGNYTGILAGVNNGSIKLCSAKGTVTGANYVGGLVGSNGAGASILNSYAAAYVSGKDYVGGLVGTNAGSLEKTYAASQIAASLFNNYIQFNGGYIEIPHRSWYETSSFTLEAWFQRDRVNDPVADFILSKGLNWFEIHTKGANDIRFIPIDRMGTPPDSFLDVKNVIQSGWFHVAAVYDYDSSTQKASARVYINGVPQDLYRAEGTINVSTVAYMSRATNPLSGNKTNLYIGRRSDGSYPFYGKISDVRIWNKARTQEEIIADKNKKLSGTESGLIGYWKLDEASGTVAYDSTANGNAGSFVGAVSRVQETAAAHQGGLAGDNSGTISASYYDADVSGQIDARGISTTTENMKKAETFADWNFGNIWGWANDYPYLRAVNFTLGTQAGKLVKGTAGSATFSLATVDVPDGIHPSTFSWFANTDGSAGAASPNGVTPSLGIVSSNAATVTMAATSEAVNGTYYFNVATNGMVSGIQTLTIMNPSYVVTFDAEGGTVSPGSQEKLYGSTYGKASDGTTSEVLPTPSKAGYTFGGWWTEDNGTGSQVTDTTVVTTATAHTLYAKWEANTYTVQYDANGGAGTTASSSHTYDALQALTGNGFTRTGYHFAGWAESAGGSVVYDDGESVQNLTDVDEATVTLYAKWEVNTYTVQYDSNGGAGTMAPSSHTYDALQALTNNGFTRTGYHFMGWAERAGGSVVYDDGESVQNLTDVNAATVTLYAKWEANTYTVQYDANGGTGTTASSSHIYDTLQALTGNGFTWAGYHFVGWAESAGDSAVYDDGENVQNLTDVNAATVTLYAKWEANTYTVQYDANGGAGTTAPSSHTYDALQALTGNGFTWAGYHFAGWAESAGGSAVYDDAESVQNLTDVNAATVTLYAKWAANTYTVQYDANGGAGTTAPSSHTYDALQVLTGNGFTWAGYHFAGWAESAGGSAVYDNGESVQNLTDVNTATVTLYAKWEANTCEVVEVPGSIPNADLVDVEPVGDALAQSVEIRIQDSAEAEEEIQAAIESDAGLAGIVPAQIFPLDISMYIKGTNTRVQLEEGEAVLITCPIPPELLAGKDSLVVVCVENGKLVILPTQVVTVNDVYCVQFTATHFSPYAIVVSGKDASDDRKATVITGAISDITYSDATLTGTVRSTGGAAVTERGFVIGTMPDPVLGGEGVTQITLPGGKGSFSAKVEKLLPAMTYYVRAYAINSAGVSYGKSMSLSTGYVGDGKAAIPKTGGSVGAAPLLLFGLAIAAAGTLQALRRKRRADSGIDIGCDELKA